MFVRATVITALATANSRPLGSGLAVPASRGANARPAVGVGARAGATATDKEVGKQLEHKPVRRQEWCRQLTGITGRADVGATRRDETHVKHLLPHGGRVRGALVGQQPLGDGAAGGYLVVFIERAGKEESRGGRGVKARQRDKTQGWLEGSSTSR